MARQDSLEIWGGERNRGKREPKDLHSHSPHRWAKSHQNHSCSVLCNFSLYSPSAISTFSAPSLPHCFLTPSHRMLLGTHPGGAAPLLCHLPGDVERHRDTTGLRVGTAGNCPC